MFQDRLPLMAIYRGSTCGVFSTLTSIGMAGAGAAVLAPIVATGAIVTAGAGAVAAITYFALRIK